MTDRVNKRVQIFDQQGKFLGKWTDLGVPQGLYYVKSEDVLYMCDGNDSLVVKVDLHGKILGVLGSFGKVPGKIDTPHYVAVESTGSIFAADFRNWRVDKFVEEVRICYRAAD